MEMIFANKKTEETILASCARLKLTENSEDQAKIIALDRMVYQGLSQKSIYVPMAPWELEYLNRIDAKFFGVFVESQLLAYYVFLHFNNLPPNIPPELITKMQEAKIYNLAKDLPLIPRDEQEKTIEIHRALFHPKLQNYGVNQYFLPKLFALVANEGYLHLTATISPDNRPSFISAIKSGLTVCGLKTKYGDKVRYLMYKPLKQDPIYEGKALLIDHQNLALQKQKLAEGYRARGVDKTYNAQGEPVIRLVYDLVAKQQ